MIRPSARKLTASLLALAVPLGACGYQSGGEVDDITPEQLFGLDQTTTTSTTTTTTTTTTTVPDTAVQASAPAASTSVAVTVQQTTTTAVLTQPVELYFIDGTRMISVSQNLSSPTSLSRVLDALERGPPPGDVGFGLRSAVPAGVVNTVTRAGGVATVELVPDQYEEIDPEDELPAIAQMVLTLTRQSGVGQVRFTLDGNPLRVRLGNNLVSQPGEPVSADDYDNLVIGENTTAVNDGPSTTSRATTTTERTIPRRTTTTTSSAGVTAAAIPGAPDADG